MSTVLVTGGSGFVGSPVILLLLRAGHVVRTTVRSLGREPSVRTMLRGAGVDGATEGGALEMSVVNTAGIFGPVLGADFSSSIELVKRLMNGAPGCPQLY